MFWALTSARNYSKCFTYIISLILTKTHEEGFIIVLILQKEKGDLLKDAKLCQFSLFDFIFYQDWKCAINAAFS